MARVFVRLAVAALSAITLSACAETVSVTSQGAPLAKLPWRSCGMTCEQAFAEVQSTHGAAGEACEALIAASASLEVGDRLVAAAMHYDAAVLLVLRGKGQDALARVAKAEALDPDPAYRQLELQLRDLIARTEAR